MAPALRSSASASRRPTRTSRTRLCSCAAAMLAPWLLPLLEAWNGLPRHHQTLDSSGRGPRARRRLRHEVGRVSLGLVRRCRGAQLMQGPQSPMLDVHIKGSQRARGRLLPPRLRRQLPPRLRRHLRREVGECDWQRRRPCRQRHRRFWMVGIGACDAARCSVVMLSLQFSRGAARTHAHACALRNAFQQPRFALAGSAPA